MTSLALSSSISALRRRSCPTLRRSTPQAFFLSSSSCGHQPLVPPPTAPTAGYSFFSYYNHHRCFSTFPAKGKAGGGGSSGFSMELLKDLRTRSGAPIVDCKKALQHADNDMAGAMDWLREHGAAKASSKLKGRETSEGLIGMTTSADGKSASLVKLASETDFAGRSAMCVDLVLSVAEAALETRSLVDTETILETKASAAADSGGNSKTVKDLLDEAIVAIRENLSLPNVVRMEAGSEGGNGILVGYVHNRVDPSRDAGTAAALVELAPEEGKKDVTKETLQAVGKKLAMHVVAARPQYMSPEDVPESELEKEKEILTKQQESSGKPPEIVEKIVLGRLRKFYEGVCLTEQAHMIEEKNPKVGKVLKSHGITIKRFELLSISQ